MDKQPVMKSCRIQINYSADDGFRSEAAYSSKRSGSPEECLYNAADEIARLAELFGFGDLIEFAVQDARKRVREWKAAA